MKKSRWHFFKTKWFWIGIVIIAAVLLIVWSRRGSSSSTIETATATIGDVVETVSVTGTVSPVDKADLSFEKGGVISRIYVKVGDTVKKGDAVAALDSASDKAVLAAAQATLSDISRNLTPEELAVQKTALANAEKDATNAAHDALVKAQNAIFDYADDFFTGAQSPNPTLSVRTDSSILQTKLDMERLSLSDLLNVWSADLSSATGSASSALLSRTNERLSTIKSFMIELSAVVNALNTSNSGMPAAMISADVTSMNAGLSTLNAAIDSVAAAGTELSTAQSNYALKLAGNSAQSIAAEAAKVAQAQALLDQDTISSPIDGIVTKADPNIGEYVAPGQSGFSIQNSGFKIEAYVPEADIAKVAIGDLASSTLDAYGSDTDFPARVTMIDPAETVLEGVPTYKVTLVFVSPDARIRSGMTSNLEILTHVASHVLEIPYRAITDVDGAKTVRLVGTDGKSYKAVPVTVGLKGSSGTIEIVSGLKVGNKVVTYVK